MKLRCLFHVHTKFSFDSWLSPREIVSRARDAQIDVLMVTDHNSVRGSVEVARLARGNPKYVIVGGEYKTEKGDIIGLFFHNYPSCTGQTRNAVFSYLAGRGAAATLAKN